MQLINTNSRINFVKTSGPNGPFQSLQGSIRRRYAALNHPFEHLFGKRLPFVRRWLSARTQELIKLNNCCLSHETERSARLLVGDLNSKLRTPSDFFTSRRLMSLYSLKQLVPNTCFHLFSGRAIDKQTNQKHTFSHWWNWCFDRIYWLWKDSHSRSFSKENPMLPFQLAHLKVAMQTPKCWTMLSQVASKPLRSMSPNHLAAESRLPSRAWPLMMAL